VSNYKETHELKNDDILWIVDILVNYGKKYSKKYELSLRCIGLVLCTKGIDEYEDANNKAI
jgi:hypothetical protein